MRRDWKHKCERIYRTSYFIEKMMYTSCQISNCNIPFQFNDWDPWLVIGHTLLHQNQRFQRGHDSDCLLGYWTKIWNDMFHSVARDIFTMTLTHTKAYCTVAVLGMGTNVQFWYRITYCIPIGWRPGFRKPERWHWNTSQIKCWLPQISRTKVNIAVT